MKIPLAVLVGIGTNKKRKLITVRRWSKKDSSCQSLTFWRQLLKKIMGRCLYSWLEAVSFSTCFSRPYAVCTMPGLNSYFTKRLEWNYVASWILICLYVLIGIYNVIFSAFTTWCLLFTSCELILYYLLYWKLHMALYPNLKKFYMILKRYPGSRYVCVLQQTKIFFFELKNRSLQYSARDKKCQNWLLCWTGRRDYFFDQATKYLCQCIQ